MKTLKASAMAALLLAPLTLCAQTAPPECPTATGAYLLQAGKWMSVDPSHSIGFKTTNVAGAAFSYGAAKAKVKAQFRDARSPYQVEGNTFAMCLIGVADSGRDVTLAKFQEEKDHRELAMASYRMWTGINAQIDPKSIVPVTVDKKADKSYLVVSKDPLPVGEFMLFTIIPDVQAMVKSNTAGALGGYDFGAHAK
jgi:hypothetical protein